MGTEAINRPPFSALDTLPQLTAIANETSDDEKYLGHEFVTYQGWWEWADGYTPPEARDAVLGHLRGWMYQSASLARHCLRSAYILGRNRAAARSGRARISMTCGRDSFDPASRRSSATSRCSADRSCMRTGSTTSRQA